MSQFAESTGTFTNHSSSPNRNATGTLFHTQSGRSNETRQLFGKDFGTSRKGMQNAVSDPRRASSGDYSAYQSGDALDAYDHHERK